MTELTDEAKQRLLAQLVKLGDMMGDDLHHEPGGRWISKEYNMICRRLGYITNKPRKSNVDGINELMVKRVEVVKCQHCGGELTQTRSGAKRAQCQNGHKWQLLK